MDLSLHEGNESKRSSMLYQVLPAVVQSRIPSFRRSISTYRRRGLHSKSSSVIEMSRPSTPPPDYTSRPGSGYSTPNSQISNASDSVFDNDDASSDMASSTASAPPPAVLIYETITGIIWPRARHDSAWQLLRLAHAHATTQPPDDDAMATVIRTEYIYGTRLLLQALPNNLTPDEIRDLRAAVPPIILDAQAAQPLAVTGGQGVHVARQPSESLAWRAAAWLVFKLLVIIQVLLPYIGLFMRKVADFDNEHQISRRLVATSVNTADYLGRQGFRASQAVVLMHDGAVRDAVYNGAVYYAGQIAGGMQEGVQRALQS
ncbi:hypothetical protein EK21DRAFT_51647 [Setomelanomma holmii]|uniref:Uncharacterized protein n=1 Tax=Setomelanomma holmii TaxID=210430 RepID=A0A9P4HLR7_9PLEO|nr:hypothetical protein EK21DRAFT_51647 [Setomelanomma holmii]